MERLSQNPEDAIDNPTRVPEGPTLTFHRGKQIFNAFELLVGKLVATPSHWYLPQSIRSVQLGSSMQTFYRQCPFFSDHDRTKWLVHYEVAVPLIEQGAPIIIPGAYTGRAAGA